VYLFVGESKIYIWQSLRQLVKDHGNSLIRDDGIHLKKEANTIAANVRGFQKRGKDDNFDCRDFKTSIPKASCSQFHQHFTYAFFVRTLFGQLFLKLHHYVEKAAKMTFVPKICT
jgi:hypothetical protein